MRMKKRSLRFVMTVSVLMINTASAVLTIMLIWMLGRFRLFAFLLLPQAALVSSIVIGTVISAIVYHRVLKPIDRLILLTQRIKKGDFSARSDPSQAIGNISELVTSFNSMAEELGSVEMLKSDFINTFSHEFKTPIISIRGFARQLKRTDLSDSEREEYIDIIIHESERLTQMSTNVLLLSRFENEQTIHNTVDFSLDEQLRTCILILEKSWEAKEIVWNLELEKATLHSNPSVIEHIWINLLSNAIKFSPAGSEITVQCSAEEGRVAVTVSDRGEGMTPETLNRIFDKFYQGDASHSGEGNGLGLSIVKRIVTLANGEISVTSTPGQGTAFRVVLPR
jgi:signal transduction histidine kinase